MSFDDVLLVLIREFVALQVDLAFPHHLHLEIPPESAKSLKLWSFSSSSRAIPERVNPPGSSDWSPGSSGSARIIRLLARIIRLPLIKLHFLQFLTTAAYASAYPLRPPPPNFRKPLRKTFQYPNPHHHLTLFVALGFENLSCGSPFPFVFRLPRDGSTSTSPPLIFATDYYERLHHFGINLILVS